MKLASIIDNGRIIKATLKSEIEEKVSALLEKYDANHAGEKLDADVYKIEYKPDRKTVHVIFNDENMEFLISGNISSNIYDEFEDIIRGLGYEMVDADGSRMILEKIK